MRNNQQEAEIYDRLEEIQAIIRILAGDIRQIKSRLGPRAPEDMDSEIAGARRSYVRAVFALIEAVVDQHKRLLIDLVEKGCVALGDGTVAVLAEQVFVAQDNGAIRAREQFLTLIRKIRAVYKAAEDAFGHSLRIDYSDQGWSLFKSAIEVRNRITHPKSYLECGIGVGDLDLVEQAEQWFKAVNNEFVRVARQHREVHKW